MENKNIIMILILVIVILALGVCILLVQQNTNETNVEINQNETTQTEEGDTEESSSYPHSLSVVPEFDKTVNKSQGEYTVEATKWQGSTVGGFEVLLYKNGQVMNRESYQSRAYFNDGSGWEWSSWDYGEEDVATMHKYAVSNDVKIKEVEVRF